MEKSWSKTNLNLFNLVWTKIFGKYYPHKSNSTRYQKIPKNQSGRKNEIQRNQIVVSCPLLRRKNAGKEGVQGIERWTRENIENDDEGSRNVKRRGYTIFSVAANNLVQCTTRRTEKRGDLGNELK